MIGKRAARPVMDTQRVTRDKGLALQALTCFCTMLDGVEDAVRAAKKRGTPSG